MINGFGRKGFYNSQEIGLGRALAGMGHHVTIYKCLPKDQEAEERDVETRVHICYLPISGLGAHGYLNPSVIRRDLDGLLIFGDNQIFLPHIYRYCRKHRIPVVPYVGTAHGYPEGTLKSRISDTLFAMGTLRIYKKHPVLVKTEHAGQELAAKGVPCYKVAPVGLDFDALKGDFKSYDRAELRREFGFSPEDVILCNVSRMEEEKRPLDLIEIFRKVRAKKPFKLLLIGEGPLYQQVQDKIAACGLTEDVVFLKRVPYEEMWKIYTISDYYLNLSRIEIFGMAILEAIYYETSVAANKAIGPSVILKGMEGHTLCENDHQFEEWLLADYPSREQLERSSKKVQREFSWNRCAQAFLEVLKQSKT
jgi:1,2-diacylglycerol 3-alpha-glucosyltransferase